MTIPYEIYHKKSLIAGDIDPGVTCLKYIADRYELNLEQRYWIAFLYGTNYCAPTTFYIYNEFPDYSGANVERLTKWWEEKKGNLIFQTDRLRIKSNNQFIPAVISYKKLAGSNQREYFKGGNYESIYRKVESIKYFGRFSVFNYLDVLNRITDVRQKPPFLNMIEAESCRNGLCYAIGREDLVDKRLTSGDARMLHDRFLRYLNDLEGDIFQIETTLCAYKKYRKGKRYVGFYIDRMFNEIRKLESNVTEGVAWEALWQFRKETFDTEFLKEDN